MPGYDPSFDPFSSGDPFSPGPPPPPAPPPPQAPPVRSAPRGWSTAPEAPATRGWATDPPPPTPRIALPPPRQARSTGPSWQAPRNPAPPRDPDPPDGPAWGVSCESTGPIRVVAPPKSESKPAISPPTVFLGSYAFAGIAAVLLAAAIALGLALSDFRSQHISPTLILAFIAASLVLATAVLWLGVLDGRGYMWARKATWGVCAAALCAAAAVFVFDPGTSVAWFGQLLRFGAVVLMVVAVIASLLLGLPQSNAYFSPRKESEPIAAAAPSPPSPSAPRYTPAPWMPTNEPDPDPFS
jgi:hypothetical protein